MCSDITLYIVYRIVARAVIDNDDLEAGNRLGQRRRNFVERLFNDRTFVVAGNERCQVNRVIEPLVSWRQFRMDFVRRVGQEKFMSVLFTIGHD